jgi:excisionase family DNA binding protein
METAKLVWSVKEAALALGLSPWTIRRYIAIGKLATVRLGRRVLLEPSECFRLIEEGRKALPRR